MSSSHPRRRVAYAAMSIVGLGALIISTGRAAPILSKPTITSEMHTLAGIHGLRFVISALPQQIEDAVGRRAVRQHCAEKLSHRGFTLRDEDETPITLRLAVYYREDDSVPKGAAVVCFLTLEQPVRIERLGKVVSIPTWTGASIDVAAKERLNQTVMRGLDEALGDFFHKSKLATADRRKQ